MSYEECRQLVEATAAKYGLEPALVCAVIQVESGWQANAYNPSGATGLMQDGAAWSDPTKRWQLDVSDSDLLAFLKEQVLAGQSWPASREVLDLCERLGISAEDDKQ